MDVDFKNSSIEETKIDIDLLSSLNQRLEGLPSLSSQRCIYRVPKPLRDINPKAYTPKMVSIGPLHHGRQDLRAMEELKSKYLHHLVSQFEVSLQDLVECVKEKEQELRDSYAEIIKLCSQKYLEIILVDAAFIIGFLLRIYDRKLATPDDPIFYGPKLRRYIRDDLFLLENQLPFFIFVEILARIPRYGSEANPFFITLAAELIKFRVSDEVVKANLTKFTHGGVKHLLHMVLICYQLPDTPPYREEVKNISVPGAFWLHQAGVEFKVRSSTNPADLHFENGVLQIPRIEIWETTEELFQNLKIFEQCHFDYAPFSHYVGLMGWLVNTSQDAEILMRNKVIDVEGNPVELSTLFRTLSKAIYIDPKSFFYSTLCDVLNDYCDKRRHRWKATLKQKYFNTPWTAISVWAATILLILTFLQTLFSAVSLF